MLEFSTVGWEKAVKHCLCYFLKKINRKEQQTIQIWFILIDSNYFPLNSIVV